MGVSGQLHAMATSPQGKSPQYPLNRRVGGSQSWSGHGGEEKNPSPCHEFNPSHLVFNMVLIYHR